MKLGTGNKKYKFKFKYIDYGATSIKNIYADTEAEARNLFDTEYKNFKVEILEVQKI